MKRKPEEGSLIDRLREIPPTGGLPLSLRHFLTPWRHDFTRRAADYIGVQNAGLECSGTACLIVILTTLKRLSARWAKARRRLP